MGKSIVEEFSEERLNDILSPDLVSRRAYVDALNKIEALESMTKQMSGFVAIIDTESGDRYVYFFKEKPSASKLNKAVWEAEGKCAELQFYEETNRIDIREFKI